MPGDADDETGNDTAEQNEQAQRLRNLNQRNRTASTAWRSLAG